MKINPSYYSTLVPFYHIRSRERAKYATVIHSKFMYCTAKSKFHRFSGRRTEKNKFSSGIINLLLRGHFVHCSFQRPLELKHGEIDLKRPQTRVRNKRTNKGVKVSDLYLKKVVISVLILALIRAVFFPIQSIRFSLLRNDIATLKLRDVTLVTKVIRPH